MTENMALGLFGRPANYTDIVRGPTQGPSARTAPGTGRTGAPTGGTGAQLPGYVSDNQYEPTLFQYQPRARQDFLYRPPQTFPAASDGKELLGTYRAHDFVIGQRFNHQMRAAANWQVIAFPDRFRDLNQWQQVQKYRVLSATLSARPLTQENYFLGYQVDPKIAAQIGQSNLGYMGSQ